MSDYQNNSDDVPPENPPSKHKNAAGKNPSFSPVFPLPLWLWITGFVLAVLKIKLTAGMTLSANAFTRYDDRLFLTLAQSLMNGDWLGPYNHLTLAKGPFYPFWIAFNASMGIPLLLAQHLLYIGACVTAVMAIRPLFPNPIVLLTFFSVLLFNPMSFTDEVMTRVVREGIYPALTLLVFGCAVGFLARVRGSVKGLMPWALGLGLSLAAFWMTREEGHWILPSLILVWGLTLYKIWKLKKHRFAKRILWALPLILGWTSVLCVAWMNHHYYGVFLENEFKSPHFLKAYGALSRVRPEKFEPMVPVSGEVRKKVYAVSPAFSRLRPFLEGGIGNGWSTISCTWISVCHDIGGGWFMWAFRDAVAAAGFHSSANGAARYYHRLAEEINAACTFQRLHCRGPRSTLLPVWNGSYLWPTVKTFFGGLAFTVKLEGFNPVSGPSIGTEKSMRLFREMTHESLTPPAPKKEQGYTSLSIIGILYQFSVPVLSVLAIALFLIRTYRIVSLKNLDTLWVITLALLTAVTVRLLMLSIIEVTSFPAISTLYIAPDYPLWVLMIGFSIVPFWPVTLKRKAKQGKR